MIHYPKEMVLLFPVCPLSKFPFVIHLMMEGTKGEIFIVEAWSSDLRVDLVKCFYIFNMISQKVTRNSKLRFEQIVCDVSVINVPRPA